MHRADAPKPMYGKEITMKTALKTRTLLETLGPGARSRPLRAVRDSSDTGSAGAPGQQLGSGRLRLHREAEIPRLLAALGSGDPIHAASAEDGDGRRPEELATFRQERRQITAITRVVCQATAEVLAGLRQHQQLSRWLAPEVHDKVRQRGELMARHRSDAAVQAGPLAFGSIRSTQLREGVWEVSVVFSDEQRVRACALRLQAHRRRWRVTAMELG